jgi:hypothetical protein
MTAYSARPEAFLSASPLLRFWETHGNLVWLPRDLRVDTSLDGTRWVTAFEDRPGGLALTGALQLPRVMPLRVDLRDVTGRYVRVNAPGFGAQAITIYQPARD